MEMPHPDDMERAANEAALAQLARQAGLDPDRELPPSVAAFLPAFGRATALRARRHLDDPDALRWCAVAYTFWSGKLLEYADAAEAANHAAVSTAVEALLRESDKPDDSTD